MAQCTKQDLEYIINHVVFPPKLPQQVEGASLIASAEKALLELVLLVTERFCQQGVAELETPWLTVQDMLSRWIKLTPVGDISEKQLVKAILDLKPGDVLPIRIRAQNAGIILRHHGTDMSIECFELSAPSADVIGCMGSLRQSFPAHGVAIPLDVATDPDFCNQLCSLLKKLDSETVEEMMPKSTKAGSEWNEIRDTCHPGLITEYLMGTLAAVGKPCKIMQIQKRIRDDVLWKNCRVPWRRSSLWLLARVAVHTTLVRNLGPEESSKQYKNFMNHLLTHILDQASSSHLGSDRRKVVQTKIARRTAKLGTAVIPFVLELANSTFDAVSQAQNRRWQGIQKQDANRKTTIDLGTVAADTNLTLHNSRPTLDAALQEIDQAPQPALQLPSATQNWLAEEEDGPPGVNFFLQSPEEKVYALAEFEQWVWRQLPAWLHKVSEQSSGMQCMAIARSAAQYREMASEVYGDCPVQMSLMLLTLGELWRTVDTLAGILVPLLHHYAPEIPHDVFEPLLLPKKAHMKRLQDLELHINNRNNKAKFKTSSVFRNPKDSDMDCFASQYFEKSPDHQKLRQKIVDLANVRKDAKRKEWQRLSDEYNSMKQELDNIKTCTMRINYRGYEEHVPTCRKCFLKNKMSSMKIDVFEWPLPKDEVQCRLAIFELRCPIAVAAWRNITWMILQDLGRHRKLPGKKPKDKLMTYSGLSGFLTSSDSRVVLASTTKSVTVSHYRQADIPVKLENVYSDNGLRWRFYDENQNCWMEDQTDEPCFSSMCRTSLPQGPYKNLEYMINSTTHTQNGVLAAQTECTSELNLHEFIAFGSLRADGERTQWLNICRELPASNLTWNTQSVCCLIEQSAWQSGSSGATYLRIAHGIFGFSEFCATLLSNLSQMLVSIQANYQSIYAMNIIIVLGLRLASLATADDAVKALDLLLECRLTISHWIPGLVESLRKITNAKQISNIRRSLLRAALLSKMTFDVDREHIEQVMASTQDLDHWTASSMIVHDNTPGAEAELPSELRRLLMRDRKLSHRLHRHLQDLLSTTSNTGLDRAVSRTWSTFKASATSWRSLQKPHHRWIQKTASDGNQMNPQTVSYNVLDGRLLIDRRPLGTLPREYTTDSLFVRIFGAQILRVSASDMAGMLYMTAGQEYGYRFYFAFKPNRLVIRATRESILYELIPHGIFTGDFPIRLVEDYTHWLNIGTNEVEFRPLTDKWTVNSNHWRLLYKPDDKSHLQDSKRQLVDIQSRTSQEILTVFGGLERVEYMYITLSFGGKFQVALPRLGLRFFMNDDGEFECQELRKLIDMDQSVGALIGLRSRLVLCAPGRQSRGLDRTVLIPRGNVFTELHGDHLNVEVRTTGRDVQCFQYQINGVLGRLEGDGSFASRVYQAYLHAVTTYILPDPLTGRLGTERSLEILSEQVFRCCKPLDLMEMKLLNLVAELTPRRTFYPEHLQVMQQVTWRPNLCPLSQHCAFVDLAECILTNSQRFNVFHPNDLPVQKLDSRGDEHLLQRAKIRNSVLFNGDPGCSERTNDNDRAYSARDTECQPERANGVYTISSHVFGWLPDLCVTSKLVARWKVWGTVSGFGTSFSFTQRISELLKLNLATSWAPIYEFCRQATRDNSRYKLLFLFSQIAFGSKGSSLDDLKALLAFATNSSLKSLPGFPSYKSFTLNKGSAPDRAELKSLIKGSIETLSFSRTDLTPAQRRQEAAEYEKVSLATVDKAVDHCIQQWPCKQPSAIPYTCGKWLNVHTASTSVQGVFAEWYKNRGCLEHLALIQSCLDATHEEVAFSKYGSSEWHQVEPTTRSYLAYTLPTLTSVMRARNPTTPGLPTVLHHQQNSKESADTKRLRSLIVDFGNKASVGDEATRTLYKSDLLGSLDAYRHHSDTTSPDKITDFLREQALTSLNDCQQHYLKVQDLIDSVLKPKEPKQRLLALAGLWPRHHVKDVLETMGWNSRRNMLPAWKSAAVAIGLGVTILQRARRMVLAVEKHDAPALYKEAENPGRLHWSADERPDWLLLEIENDLLIRPMQARVALEMIAPSSSSNTLMQLNMQMQALYQECMSSGGILLAQPEHILSFKLMGIERFASGQGKIAAQLLETQTWLNERCRDVLDESDEILDVKFQLIYTLGTQRSMDGQPDRWIMIQGIFDLVQHHAALLQSQYPAEIEVGKRAGPSFPAIRLLSSSVRRLLIARVAEDICGSKVPGLVMLNLPAEVKQAATTLIKEHSVGEDACATVLAHCTGDQLYLKKLLLVRGFIAGGILIHVLHAKRWSVTYGLHPRRCLCAVPYRAKGVPAPTAEFGHPDVMIALTCLSYYYDGLTDSQLRSCLKILQKADDPTLEYGTWVQIDPSFPEGLRYWNAVNLEDQQQCNVRLFPALRYNKKVADFFLTNVVFPKEGKEFDQKLSTSGWDIPAKPGSKKVTTGFSGTNDNRFLLPSLISQHDLVELQHTSGKVLEIVSRPENLSYHCAKNGAGVQLTSEGLLKFIRAVDPKVRVLIDVGAQILDLSNEQVIAQWLFIVPEAEAGVYFDENDYAMVLTKAGKREKLANSSFSKQMDRFLIYLDDVHTRGTDLKLPGQSRAAVTLGPRLVKDRLVQACMRLRQLGQGQSLMFVAPPEVHREILKTTSKAPSAKLDGLDVIEWALEQSCLQIERNQPLRVVQGLNYFHRRENIDELSKSLPTLSTGDECNSLGALVKRIIEREAQSLHDLYSPEPMRSKDDPDMVKASRKKSGKEIQELIGLWDRIGVQAARSASLHEEQEREVAHEVEQETQIERPPAATPLKPKLDRKLMEFIRSGTPASIERFLSAYDGVLMHSSAAPLLNGRLQPWSHVRVSQDFVDTINCSKVCASDHYIRPVHWVLVSKDEGVGSALLISQYEVNRVFNEIQAPTSRVTLVCYEPRVTRSMLSLDASTNSSFSLPGAKVAWESLSIAARQELHLFSGQLYFTTFEEYKHLSEALVNKSAAPPIFIKEWAGIRRKGQNYLQTHVGQIVNGRLLQREMFETVNEEDAAVE
ncbi:MAG: hypothetical protein Q9208_005334 [Pyrenodesmia sp. 3 TL-2023]